LCRDCRRATAYPAADRYREGIDDLTVIQGQLGREPRGFVRVAARCPYGRPAVIEQRSYLEDGEPFPTTYHLSCPYAVRRVASLEAAGGIDRYEALVASDAALRRSYEEGRSRQRALRRPAVTMVDGGASLELGIGGTQRAGAVKCLHAHVAFALAEPGYELGERAAAEAAPLFPAVAFCCG